MAARNGSIRLTNRTAIHLRHSARRVQTAGFAFAGAVTLALAAAAVLLGLYNIWAVVAVVVAAVLVDALIIVRVRAEYFKLLGMAICTEAAARELAADTREQHRRRQAEEDLRRVKQDVQQAAKRGEETRAQAEQNVLPMEAQKAGRGVLSLDEKINERRREQAGGMQLDGRTQVIASMREAKDGAPQARRRRRNTGDLKP